MQRSQLAVKFALPFAANAGAGDNAYPIPVGSQTGGRASLNDGFPPPTFVPIASGGIPPWGEDMNGILYQSTAWLQSLQAGAAISYDSAFQTAIGGYPQGAIIESAVYVSLKWVSTTDNNTTNPDTGGAGWLNWPFVFYALDGGAVNALTATYPLPLAAIPIGTVIWVNPANTSTITTPSLAINGGAPVTLTTPLAAPLAGGALVQGIPAQIMVGAGHALWLLNSQAGGVAPSSGSRYFGTPSTTPFTIPAPTMTLKGWGAGGGGGGFYNGEFNGGGGGGGGYGEVVLTGLTVGATLSVIIGVGGAGGSASNGSPGGITQVTLSGTPLLYLTGGGGGGNSGGDASGNFGGAGGTSLYGTINIIGQYGSPFYLTGGSSPGGGVGGVGTAGNPGLTSPYPASSPGGGGGGGLPGGAGMPGGILFTWGT